jgi:hypothetical protein
MGTHERSEESDHLPELRLREEENVEVSLAEQEKI